MSDSASAPAPLSAKRKREHARENAEAGPSGTNHLDDTEHGRIDDWYVVSLDDHIKSTRKRLIGPVVPRPNRGPPTARLPTIVPPINATFTAEDKGKFFLALQRHSRFRPVLIAHDIGREVIEVEYYLDLLEAGQEAVQRNTGDQIGQRSRAQRYKGRYWWEEGFAPAVREVSEEWVEEEDRIVERVAWRARGKGRCPGSTAERGSEVEGEKGTRHGL